MSGRARLDNKKFRATFQTKATMLSFEEVEPLTGHPVGGLCPFGLKGSPKIFWTNQYADIIMSTLLRATTITRLKSVPPSLKG
jgi:prolyl-tRNA editing enzyme YbaK/EbsC (Cys-tRNA(Pro) deacylase)